jgi:C4-dicarboxylate-specific signal transduction histidine kinase
MAEMKHDVERLGKVSRRFELIGHRPALRPVSLYDVIDRLGRYYQARTPSTRGRVEVRNGIPPQAPAVLGNETLLRGGTITLTWLGIQAGSVRLRFSDDGPGVDPLMRRRLFDVGATTKQGGWGVGLSLARRILASLHGGGIRLEPAEEGASFLIELPAARTVA